MTRREWLGTALLMAQDQAPPVCKGGTRLVEVQATVQDGKKKYVTGLGQRDFAVLDNGAEQVIEHFETNGSSLTLALMLDLTGSMSKDLPGLKKATTALLSKLRA